MVTRQFTFVQRKTVSPAAGWQWGSGWFTNDSVQDLVGYHPSNGTLWVGWNATTPFSFRRWAQVTPAAGWRFVPGDFTGTGRTDVVGYFPANGTLWLGENVGDRFDFTQWAEVDPAESWQFAAGIFTGHGHADLVGLRASDGLVRVGANTGTQFAFSDWADLSGSGPWQVVAADFTGNARADLLAHDGDTGKIWIGENTGSALDVTQWGLLAPAADWTVAAGYFSNRGKSDVFGYKSSDGSLWVGLNRGDQFNFDQWASVTPAAGWQFVTGTFNADLWADVVGYHPSNGTLWLGQSITRPVEGYCWPLSGAPGDTIEFMISAEQSVEVSINRHISTSDSVEWLAVEDVSADTSLQPVQPLPWRVGCGWQQDLQLTIPATWQSGMYSASFVGEDAASTVISFVVKPDPAQRSEIAVLANVNTWLAYNGWGGQSKYTGLARTSFLRPNPGAAPEADGHLTRGELWLLGWLETAGYQADLYTDIDFHNDGLDANQYKCLIVGTHPEYWTIEMYDNLVAYLDAGGSLAYLGGNGIFETGVYDDDQTTMIFRLGVEDGPRTPALFRVQPGRAERSLLGVATERCGVLGAPFVVVSADDELFTDTGVSVGDEFGTVGFNKGYGNGQASAWEVDTRSGPGALALPTDCIMEPEAVPGSTLPAGIRVLAQAPADAAGRGADLIAYDHPGGGCVLSAGSITVGGSLVVDAVLQQLMTNVLTRAGVAAP